MLSKVKDVDGPGPGVSPCGGREHPDMVLSSEHAFHFIAFKTAKYFFIENALAAGSSSLESFHFILSMQGALCCCKSSLSFAFCFHKKRLSSM